MIGRSLLHYTITDKLGEGGMGVVYKARDSHLDRFAALKVLPPGKVTEGERKRRFIQEAKSASALNHPNIVTIYDIATDQDVTFIAMEFIPGKTLGETIPRSGLPLPQTLNYAVQIADGLARAHQAGIIHRDLKPGNVMIGEAGRVKILDFGLAKLTAPLDTPEDGSTETEVEHTEEGAVMGTASYMSPEQAEGRKLDARSDIFSFGIVLYEMIAGRKPFHGATRIATMSAILRENPRPLSEIVREIPSELERLVDRCLRKDVERRWQTMQDLRVALLDLKEESDSGKLVSAKTVARNPRWPYAAAAAMAALLAVGIWAWRPKAQEAVRELVPVPLTAYPGDERDPAFSPDGNQIVFSWGPEGGVTNTYIKLIGPGDPIRLTNSPTAERMAQWSRDGKWIAFGRRSRDANSFVVIPALGGPERVVARTNSVYCSWTPDSRWLVIPDGRPSSLYLVPLQGGERKLLLGPLQNKYGAAFGMVSPDSRMLAVSYSIGDYRPLHVAPIGPEYTVQGEPRALTPLDWSTMSMSWTPDSKEVVFIRSVGDANAGASTSMYRVAMDGSAPKRMDFVGDNPWFLDVAPQGNRLAFTRLQRDINLHRVEFEPDGAIRKPSEAVASSTRMEQGPSYSPDGSRIAFLSNRSGSYEIWVSGKDGKDLVQLTNSVYPGGTDRPRWSPDGSKIVYASRPEGVNTTDIFIIAASGGAPQRLTDDPGSEQDPSWSRDGKWIYFSSNRGGSFDVWKMPADGGAAVQITRKGGRYAQESADGESLYYMKGPGSGPVWRISVKGGEEAEAVKAPAALDAFLPTQRGIHYLERSRDGRSALIKLAPLSGGEPKTLGTIPRPIASGLSLSPDGKYSLYSQYDQSAADIMLVENFR